jgi:DnaJ-class molecular chaperone
MDPYDVLGLQPEASEGDIRRAYRRLAMEFHPDKTQGDPSKAEHFKCINEAYSVLSDTSRRRDLDLERQLRELGIGSPDTAPLFMRFAPGFGAFTFVVSTSRRVVVVPVRLCLKDLYLGAHKRVDTPHGTFNLDIPPSLPHLHRHELNTPDRLGLVLVLEFQHDLERDTASGPLLRVDGLDVHVRQRVSLDELLYGSHRTFGVGPRQVEVSWQGYINPATPIPVPGHGLPPNGCVWVHLEVEYPSHWHHSHRQASRPYGADSSDGTPLNATPPPPCVQSSS